MVTVPAFPLLPVNVPAEMPEPSPDPTIVNRPGTDTEIVPPFPNPAVAVEMMPPPLSDRDPASTVTSPAFPLLSVLAVMLDDPPIDSAPAASTRTPPPAPEPKVAEVISARLVSAICGAVTTTDPA